MEKMKKSSSSSSSMVQAMKVLFSFLLPLSLLFGLVLFHLRSSHDLLLLPTMLPSARTIAPPHLTTIQPSCAGRYVYVHKLPERFNTLLIRQCHNLSLWQDMCPCVSNSGIGPLLNYTDDTLIPPSAWYDTNQFTLEIIFHNRMKQYDCLTDISSEAAAIFVPYYVGLDIGRHLWGRLPVTVRDSLMIEAMHWLRNTPEWAARGGRDHFIIQGRTTWDMRRKSDKNTDWGSNFMLLPETKNMTVLDIESNKWHSSEFGIPYPTHFHPSKEADIIAWQDKVRHVTRPYLFSFAGGKRKNQVATAIRDQVIEQCVESPGCKFLNCHKTKCDASNVVGLFLKSMFCVQPQGDSLTRKSLFDSMVAGCIPVFFHPGTAYQQYRWHLPREHEKYSVYIPEEDVRTGAVKIQDVLLRYSVEQIEDMRQEVIKMIPSLVYNDPRYKVHGVRDAFDIAVDRVIQRSLQLVSS